MAVTQLITPALVRLDESAKPSVSWPPTNVPCRVHAYCPFRLTNVAALYQPGASTRFRGSGYCGNIILAFLPVCGERVVYDTITPDRWVSGAV